MRPSLVIGHWSLLIPLLALLAGAAAAPQAAPAPAQPIATSINPGKMITIKSAPHDIRAYLVSPQLPPALAPAPGKPDISPAVVIVHDIFGLSPFIKAQADGLAHQGYTVLVPNLYSALENADPALHTTSSGQPDANLAWIAYDKTPDQQILQNLSAAIDYLQPTVPDDQFPPNRPLAVVGYDMGGIYAMMIAGTDLRVAAAVNYYGRILYAHTSPDRPASPVESLFNLRAPLLSFYGEIDPQVPPNQIAALRSRLENNPNKTFYEIVRFPNVGHSFLVPTRPGYNQDAAQKAAEKTRLFLARFLRTPAPPQE